MMALHLPRNMQPSCLTIAYGHLGYSVIALIPVLAYKDLLVTHTLKKITYIWAPHPRLSNYLLQSFCASRCSISLVLHIAEPLNFLPSILSLSAHMTCSQVTFFYSFVPSLFSIACQLCLTSTPWPSSQTMFYTSYIYAQMIFSIQNVCLFKSELSFDNLPLPVVFFFSQML